MGPVLYKPLKGEQNLTWVTDDCKAEAFFKQLSPQTHGLNFESIKELEDIRGETNEQDKKLICAVYVAIDTEKSCQSSRSSKVRYELMNHQAKWIIDKENLQDKRFVALVGAAHVCKTQGVPGLSEILGCPNATIGDAQDKQEPFIAFNEATDLLNKEFGVNGDPGIEGIIDVFIKRLLPKKG